ncbi:hypothetical protein ABZ202_07985 [Streptomyces sp. NPDC006186]
MTVAVTTCRWVDGMVTTISELQQLCAEQGVALPALRQTAAATDGTPVYAGEIIGTDAFRLWYDLRALHGRSGWWPVLAGEPEHLHNVFVGLEPDFAPTERQTDDRPLDGRGLLAHRAREAEGHLCGPDERARPGEDPFEAPGQRLAAHVEKELDLDLVGGTHFSAVRQERTVVCWCGPATATTSPPC